MWVLTSHHGTSVFLHLFTGIAFVTPTCYIVVTRLVQSSDKQLNTNYCINYNNKHHQQSNMKERN